MPFGSPSAGGQPQPPGGQWLDPRLKARATNYDSLLQQAAADPSRIRDPIFHQQLVQAAAAVGRGAAQIKMDVQAAMQRNKMGASSVGPGQGTPASPVAAQAATGTDTSQGSSGVAASGAYRAQDEGPYRLDVNAMLGRTLNLQDFKTLSGMTPADRVEALRQSGYDLSEFDPQWLNSNPSLDPAQQLSLAKDVATSIGKDIQNGATPDQIKLSLSSYDAYLTPAQRAEINSNITDELDAQLRIRQTQVQQTGFLRQATLNLMTRKFDAQQSNTDWEHNYKYTVLNDKNAQWSSDYSLKKQNAQTAYDRYSEEFARDQANGLVDAQGRPIKGGGGAVKTGELINTANKMLDSIRSGVNEYNQRLQTALQNPGKGGGVNAPMEADIQNQIDAYNGLVDQLNARGIGYFKHYTGPDQAAIHANTAAATAQGAVNAQGQNTPGAGAASGWKDGGYVVKGRPIGHIPGKPGWYFSDGTKVPQ